MKIKSFILASLILLVAGVCPVNAQKLMLTMDRNTIKIGETIQASARIANREDKAIEWVLVVSLLSKDPRFPVPRDLVENIKLEPGKEKQIPIALSTEGLVYNGEYQLVGKLFDAAGKPVSQSTQYTQLTGGLERLSVSFSTCKDKACKVPSKMFVQGETVYIDYRANVQTPSIKATLALPDQTRTSLDLPAAFVAEQAGDYQMIAEVTKPGYNTVRKTLMFGVIEPTHELNQPVQMKHIK